MPYFDPHSEAQMNGFAHGRLVGERYGRDIGWQEGQRDGYKTGHADGQEDGYNDGHEDGYSDGWNAAIDIANREMIKQKEITALQSGKRQRLEADVQALRELIVQLHTKYNELETRANNHASEHHEVLWKVNRCAVFMNVTRAVLEDLIADSTQFDRVRKLFIKQYVEQVTAALKKGTILTPLDADEKLTATMPRTQQFIRNMLASP